MRIIRVTSAYDRKRFIKLPQKIYKNDPNWIAPLEILIREKLNRKKNPFFMHGWAQEFLAVEGEDVLGRILVSDDSRFNAEHNTNVGMFGFFESVNDQNVANALLDEGARVLKEERGRDFLFGPVEFSTNYEYALLVDGFDSPPKAMMTYNPSYYKTLFETWGLVKNRDLFSWYFDE
ncbi:MAG: N-acetyltransferase, partial [Thermoguttaceae bacterium]|nr:N-acetyltransferase [Thermoguttaceae bacterium]